MYPSGNRPGLLRRLMNWFNPSSFGLCMSDFNRVLQCQKAFADRGQGFFALVTFEPLGDLAQAQTELWKILKKRIRAADSAGLVAPGRPAVVLPGTDESGASNLANAVLKKAGENGVRLNFEVRVYSAPENKSPPGDDRSPDARREPKRAANPPTASNIGEVGTKAASSLQSGPSEGYLHPISIRKRAFDLLVVIPALLLLSPLFALIAVAIKLDTRGPVFYAQTRVGQGSRNFTFYKFRTMIEGAEKVQAESGGPNMRDGPTSKVKDDSRVTRVGRPLRRVCFDEFPQLFNVLLGDMTLVGPRPPLEKEVKEYDGWHLLRLESRGGLTCIWQVYGRPHNVPFDDWMRMDLRYAKIRSWFLDLWLLFRTPLAILQCRGNQ